eukprot:UN0148
MEALLLNLMVAVTLIACAIWVVNQRGKLGDLERTATPFLVYCTLAGLDYGTAGITQAPGVSVPWATAAASYVKCCYPIATMMLFSVVLIFKFPRREALYVSYSFGGLISIYFLIRSFDPMLNGTIAIGACILGCGLLLVDLKDVDKKSRNMMAGGLLVQLAAFLVQRSAPASWFPASFNKNEIFHFLMVPATILQAKAVILWGYWKFYEAVETLAKSVSQRGRACGQDIRHCHCERCAIQ